MMPLAHVVEQALRDPFAAARTHAAAGGRVIGYFGAEIPVELILASDAFALKLPSLVAGSLNADKYLEASFTADTRSIAEQYLQGRFDFLSDIVLPRINDSAQRLYYYLVELRERHLASGPRPLIYDLAKIERDTSIIHSRRATRRLGLEIGARTESLGAAIEKRNRRRTLLARASVLRSSGCGTLGSVMERVCRAADFCHPEVFDDALGAWLSAPPAFASGPRLLLTGSVPPDDRLHLAVEAAGANVVAELGEHAACAASLPIIRVDASIDAIADHYRSLHASSRAFSDRAGLTRDTALAVAADGVIVWLTEQEDALIWDLPAQRSALAAADIPVLPLVRRRWDDEDGLLDRIGEFTRGLQVSA